MGRKLKAIWGLLKTAAAAWVDDKAPRLGAALSYYTVFAIPPLFVIVIFIAGLIYDENAVRAQIFQEVGGLVGEKSAQTIQSAMAALTSTSRGMMASVIAVATLLVTATGLFIELQDALNTIWGVESKPGQGILGFIKNRLLSFAIVVGIGFLLLVSLLISAALSAIDKYLNGVLPGIAGFWIVISAAGSLAVITFLFGMIFKVLPDVRIAWRDVWVGALVTALLFTAGKFLLGWYLGRSSTVSAYGAAGSIVLILLWVYYSAQILFFGAEITQVYANRFGARLQPAANARWVSPPKPGRVQAARVPDTQTRLVSELKQEIARLRHWVEPEWVEE